jgi:hypothetical protein
LSDGIAPPADSAADAGLGGTGRPGAGERERPRDDDPVRARARNAVWLGAGDYGFDPPWLFVRSDGAPDLYRNLATGLICGRFGEGRVRALLGSWEQDWRRARLDELAWTALESAAYRAARAGRPALDGLRGDFARERDAALGAEGRRVVASLQCGADMTFEQIEARVREAALRRYRFDGRVVRAPDPSLHLGVSLLGLLSGGVAAGLADPERLSVVGDGREGRPVELPSGVARQVARVTGALARAARRRRQHRERDDRAYVEALFGAPALPGWRLEAIERDVCVGVHEGCRLWVVDGSRDPSGPADGGVTLAREQARAQYERNRDLLRGSRRLVDHVVEELSRELGDRVRSQRTLVERRRRSGELSAAEAWRCDVLDDARPFARRARLESAPVCVDLLLDASGSRADEQSTIALQAYVIARGLGRCGVPVRVSAFCAVRGYTVVRALTGFSDASAGEGALRYCAAGMNRDGLALRALERLPGPPGSARRIVVMLTDAAPMDVREGFFAGGGHRGRPPGAAGAPDAGRGWTDYVGRRAIADTAQAVRDLASRGTRVVGIFDGEDERMADARTIFGDGLVRIRGLGHMADAAARLIGDAIEGLA